MRNFISAVFAVFMLLPGKTLAGQQPDYGSKDNWIICGEAENPKCEVDLFYLLPTIFSDKNKEYMEWHNNPEIRKKGGPHYC